MKAYLVIIDDEPQGFAIGFKPEHDYLNFEVEEFEVKSEDPADVFEAAPERSWENSTDPYDLTNWLNQIEFDIWANNPNA